MLHEGKPAETVRIEPIEAGALHEPEYDKPQDECGVFGIYAPGKPVGAITYYGNRQQQHRGQSGAGIAYYDPAQERMVIEKGTGLVDEAIPGMIPQAGRTPAEAVGSHLAIGHTRYSTAENDVAAQPFMGEKTGITLAHNGHIQSLKSVAEAYGVEAVDALSDSALLTRILDLRVAETGDIKAALAEVLPQVEGTYCLSITNGQQLIGARDPWGNHPLSLGILAGGEGAVIASESVAFRNVELGLTRDIAPGEVVIIDSSGVESFQIDREEPVRHCMFEHIYIGRPEGIINNVVTYQARKNMGRYLAEDQPIEADVVVGVPDSGLAAATGYAEASGIPKVEGIFKNRYATRTFLERGTKRDNGLEEKFEPNPSEIAGRSVIVVEDSIIKGNTAPKIVSRLRDAGATAVYFLSASARYENSCNMGMDTKETWRLIARGRSDEEIAGIIGADYVAFNRLEKVLQAIDEAQQDRSRGSLLGSFCTACVTGEYPIVEPEPVGPPQLAHAGQETLAKA